MCTSPLQFYGLLVRRFPSALWAEADRADKMAYLVGLLVFALVFFRPELAALPVPRWWALVVLGFLVLYALGRANYRQYSEVEAQRNESRARVAELEEQLRPRLALQFDPADERCVEDATEADAIVMRSEFRTLRLRVVNTGDTKLDRVRVLVEGIEQRMPWGEQPLKFQRDLGEETPLEPGLPPPAERRRRYPESVRGFDLAPHERTYVDLLFKMEAGQEADQFDMFFANSIPSRIPAAPKQIDLVVHANNASPLRAVARISQDDRGRPQCELEVRDA